MISLELVEFRIELLLTRRVDNNEHNSTGAPHASIDHGADSYKRNSLSVTATNTDCHRSESSELSELADRPFYKLKETLTVTKIVTKIVRFWN